MVPDEMDTTRLVPDPDLDDNLKSLLGNAPPEDSVDTPHAAEATDQTHGAEATLLAILICALPVFAGLGLPIAMENAEAAKWLEVVGESVRESLRTVQSWFGAG